MKSLILSSVLFFLIGLFHVVQTNAQIADKLHTPLRGTKERAAILDALRSSGSSPDVKNVVFTVHYLKVHNGWAWIDATPFDAATKKPVAEGGTSLLGLANGQWRVIDLSTVPEDPHDPMGMEDASTVFVRNLRRTFKNVPADIFPAPSK